MSATGRYFVHIGSRTFVVEPISSNPDRNADWTNGGIDKIKGGAVTEENSLISQSDSISHLVTLGPGESPESYIENLLKK